MTGPKVHTLTAWCTVEVDFDAVESAVLEKNENRYMPAGQVDFRGTCPTLARTFQVLKVLAIFLSSTVGLQAKGLDL